MPRLFNEKKTIFSTKPNIHIQKNEDEPLPYTIYKYQFQRIKDLNVKIKPIKLLEVSLSGQKLLKRRNTEKSIEKEENRNRK